MKERRRGSKLFWAVIPPWLIIGAVIILVPIFIFMTLENINRQKEQTTRLLLEKGAALIRSFEAGARTGIGLRWGGFQLQKLLMETAEQPDIDYLIVTDIQGTILADSDPLRIGTSYGQDLDLTKIAGSEKPAWRQVPNSEGADTFEVYRRFAPARGLPPAFFEPFPAPPPGPPPRGAAVPPPPGSPGAPPPGSEAPAQGLVIFVGLNMGPIEAAHEEDIRHTIWMALLFLLIGSAGIVSLLLAQGYRTARSSLSRIKAFSDSLVENMPIGLIATDPGGRVTAFNQTAESILGATAGEVIGKPAREILPGQCGELYLEVAQGRRLIEREIDCAVASGRTIPLELIAATLREEDDTPAGHVLLFRDMTETRRLEEEVARSRRLASLGSLAAGIAHEIRNPLSSIKGFATCFRERYRDNPEDRETAEVMIREVDRLNRVITQLLEFARPLTMARVPASLPAVIRHALRMVEGDAKKKGIAVETDLAEIGEIPLDADRMTQVFLNLYLNAIAAMDAGGFLRVSLAVQDAGTVRVAVADTGIGIPKDALPRVFDPYFTTRSSGTGLGLAIVQKIVEAHGGEVHLESEPGRGTTAVILLPTGTETKG
ncbi:MAG: PAS domain-containing protein [Deltaproteobacteria bacterium]|nr:PAS domain-containing protein [Deltaproteobacteria bacterium]